MPTRSFNTFRRLSGVERDIADDFGRTQQPKLKFNFTVSIKFREPIRVPNLGNTDDEIMDEMTFALKQASRPNPTVSYQDVNYYNYRTKVATRTDFGTMQLTFYDDNQNLGHSLFEKYLKALSPITNLTKADANLLDENVRGAKNNTFNLNNDYALFSGGASSSVGPLPSGNGRFGLIEDITIRHFYFNPLNNDITSVPRQSARGLTNTSESGRSVFNPVGQVVNQVEGLFGGGAQNLNPTSTAAVTPTYIQYVEYQFLNPKVINMTLDELDMTQSDVNTVLMNFVYDSVFINAPQSTITPQLTTDPDNQTISVDDIRGQITDLQRLIRRVRRLDTIPDISVLETAGVIVPPISGTLPDIDLPIPQVDLPGVLDF